MRNIKYKRANVWFVFVVAIACTTNSMAQTSEEINTKETSEIATEQNDKALTEKNEDKIVESDESNLEGPIKPEETAAANNATVDNEAEITKLPVQIKYFEAKYPEKALAEKIEAVVLLDLEIDKNGKVTKVEVVQPTEYIGYGFEEAAIEAAKQFEFEPAQVGEEPIAVRITYKYGFTLAVPEEVKQIEKEPVANFTGKLVERGKRTPLAGIRVMVRPSKLDTGFETMSNKEGRFEFFDLPVGELIIIIEAEGYYPLQTSENIVAGEKLEVKYYIERTSDNPYDVFVAAKRPRKEVVRQTITAHEIDRVPGTFGDPISVVKSLPSVARMPYGLGIIISRGASYEDSRAAIGGIEVPMIFHFFALRSVLPTNLIDSLDFYPGNFPVYYGRGIGGVIDIKLTDVKPERTHGYLELNLADASSYVETPISDNGTLVLGLRRSYIDAVLDFMIPDDATTTFSTAPRYYDWQLAYNFRPSPAHKFSAFIFSSDDSMKVISKTPSDDMDPAAMSGRAGFDSRFYRGILRYDYKPDATIDNELQLAIGKDINKMYQGEQFRYDIDVITIQLRERLRLICNDNLAASIGVDYQIVQINGSVRSAGGGPLQEGDPMYYYSGDTPLSTNYKNDWLHNPALFVELEWKPVDDLLIVPGVRLDYFDQPNQLTADPRLTIRYNITDKIVAKAASGIYHQTASPDQTDEAYGNPDLKTERSIHNSVGFEWQVLAMLSIDVNGFYNKMDNLAGRASGVAERNGKVVPKIYSNEAKGRAYGVDLMVRKELSHNLFGWVSYTLSRSERLDPGAKTYRLFDIDQTHILTLVASYKLPRNWEIGIRWQYTTGMTYIPFNKGVFVSDEDAYRPVVGEINNKRLGDFHQLDVRIDKHWVFDKWLLNVFLDLQNAYNRTNPEMMSDNYNYTQHKPTGGLPIIPVFGIRAEM
ncbi:MAG: TonB-dependent receptor [Deltaproteobacteria bacterium]|nr:TonB-dependent receptor [Deltaproteobacteria bacterium]